MNDDLHRCAKRKARLEKLVVELLEAWDRSEMSNVAEAIDKLRKYVAQI